MDTANLLWIAAVVVIFAITMALILARARRRRAHASRRMGLPDLGALSAEDLKHNAGPNSTAARSTDR